MTAFSRIKPKGGKTHCSDEEGLLIESERMVRIDYETAKTRISSAFSSKSPLSFHFIPANKAILSLKGLTQFSSQEKEFSSQKGKENQV